MIVVADVTVGEVCEQVLDRICLCDMLYPEEERHGVTPARIVWALWDILRSRRRNGLPPYSEIVVRDVIWTLIPRGER